MIAKTKNLFHCQLHVAIVALACVAWSWPGATTAQTPKLLPPAPYADPGTAKLETGPATPAKQPAAKGTPPAHPDTLQAAVAGTEPSRVMKIFNLKSAKSEDMVKLLTSIFDMKNTRLTANPRTNTIVFYGSSETAIVVDAILLQTRHAGRDEKSPRRFERPASTHSSTRMPRRCSLSSHRCSTGTGLCGRPWTRRRTPC